MNENAQQWVANLRSGEYKQGKESLRPGDDEFCCLGVACDTFHRVTGRGSWAKDQDGWQFSVDGLASLAALPQEVRLWLGLNSFMGHVMDPRDPETKLGGSLAGSNDRGVTFEEIADYIESEPRGLFVH